MLRLRMALLCHTPGPGCFGLRGAVRWEMPPDIEVKAKYENVNMLQCQAIACQYRPLHVSTVATGGGDLTEGVETTILCQQDCSLERNHGNVV